MVINDVILELLATSEKSTPEWVGALNSAIKLNGLHGKYPKHRYMGVIDFKSVPKLLRFEPMEQWREELVTRGMNDDESWVLAWLGHEAIVLSSNEENLMMLRLLGLLLPE